MEIGYDGWDARAMRIRLALVSVTTVLLTGCGAAPPTIDPTGVDELTIPTPTPDPADFVAAVDNPWLPLAPGTVWTYRATGDDGVRTVTVTVLAPPETVQGVAATVVRRVVTAAGGAVLEDGRAYFAQDRAGNVWQLGEERRDQLGDRVAGDSWRAGVDGAQAGLAMPAEPRFGDGFDHGGGPTAGGVVSEVVDVSASGSVPYADFNDALETIDTSRLEPGVEVRRMHAPGIGLVSEVTVTGGSERVELVALQLPPAS